MPIERRQKHGRLVAERDWKGMLQMGTTSHGGIAVLRRQIGENASEILDLIFDNGKTGLHLQDGSEVHDLTVISSEFSVSGHYEMLTSCVVAPQCFSLHQHIGKLFVHEDESSPGSAHCLPHTFLRAA